MNRREFLAAALAVPAARVGPWGRRTRAGLLLDPAQLGASTACLAGFSLLDALTELQRLDFSAVEIILYTGARHSVGEIPGFALHQTPARERERIRAATRSFQRLSGHLPFQDLQLLSSHEAERRESLATIQRALDGLAFLGGELAVVHAGWPERGKSFRDVWTRMRDTFRSLGDYAGRRGIRIGLETMQPNSVRDYTELILEIDHPMVGATVDTGHIRGAVDIDLPPERRDSAEGRIRFNDVLDRVVRDLGDKVLHLHLSDVRRADWLDHRQIGTGIVDFARLFRTLDALRYRGLLVFELEEADRLGALRASKALSERLMRSS